ncbi:uncharacterized protein LOC129602580 [Paramacrobiotus metropolitanus]|uniref:uncharacterized protein LOC129602580 n=1 Tax=Paramacrobiotus metropolitanus TaxID=2943436 RepID=UPI002445E2A4|nr:uncharacterized protein LOC129602580 [Paramacrobiotus metropolitanus]
MYLCENADGVRTWNAVDVEVDGMLQHGYVIGLEDMLENDSTPPRLIVDFGCPSQQAVLVPYGKILDCSVSKFCNAREGDDVEVLLHDGPGRPWKWYPGKMLIRGFQLLPWGALVELRRDGQVCRELLPRQQIRDVSSEAVKPIPLPAGHFVVQTWGVPNGYWALEQSASAMLLRKVEREFSLRFVKVLSQEMHYVRRRQEAPFSTENVAASFERGRKNHAYCHQLDERTEESEPKRKKPLTFGERGLPLPLEVLKEVLRCLDTVDQQRCRRTCQLWETLLTSAELCQVLRVSRQQPRLDRIKQWDCNYAMYCCIFKHITPTTHTLCIHDAEPSYLQHWNRSAADEVGALLKKVLDDAGMRIERCIVHQRSIRMQTSDPHDQCSIGVLCAETALHLSQLVSCSDRVIWKDYSLALAEKRRVTLMEFRIPSAVFTRGYVSAARIADLLEQHLRCDEPPLSAERIGHCMASHIDSGTKAVKIMQILRDYQSCDPRPSAHYRGYEWSADNVADVDVGKLNGFCLRALANCWKDWCPASANGDAQAEHPSSEVRNHETKEEQA